MQFYAVLYSEENNINIFSGKIIMDNSKFSPSFCSSQDMLTTIPDERVERLQKGGTPDKDDRSCDDGSPEIRQRRSSGSFNNGEPILDRYLVNDRLGRCGTRLGKIFCRLRCKGMLRCEPGCIRI